MERAYLFPKLVRALLVPHAVEDLFAQASEENVTSFRIPLLVILLRRSGLVLIGYFRKANDGGRVEK